MIKDFIEYFVFFPNKEIKKTPSILNIPFEDIYLKDNTDNIYHGWYIQGNYKNNITQTKCILFFHGNAGNISFRLNYINKFYELGFSLLFFDYPAFGNSTGSPSEENCIKCSTLFYDYLVNTKKFNSNNIILYGESIGGSIASSVANIYNVKYLVLQSTFTNIKEIIKLVTNINVFFYDMIGFNTIETLKSRYKLNRLNKKMKTLVIHSNEDELIDINHGLKLSKYANLFYMASGSHSNIEINDDFIFHLLSFVKD